MVIWIITPIESEGLHFFRQNVTFIVVLNLTYIGELMVIIPGEIIHEEYKMIEEPINVADDGCYNPDNHP